MDMPVPAEVRIAGLLLDRRAGGLFRLGPAGAAVPVAIGSRAIEILSVLAARPGELVSKRELMDAVWPDTVVEDKNLTVQVSILRGVLEREGGRGGSIQTVPGRGYRLVVPLEEPPAPAPGVVAGRRPAWRWIAAVLVALGIVVGGLLFAMNRQAAVPPPRLSLVVLPFQNIGGDPGDEYLADAITDDLTSDLSHIPSMTVIARASAGTYKGKQVDARQVGRELGVRYVLGGSVRRVGAALRVNAQLASAETGAQVWSDRFDQSIADLSAGQHDIVSRIKGPLGITLIDVEGARGAQDRPANPDAFDLVLRARSLWWNQPPNSRRRSGALALYERALLLDPASVPAMLGIAHTLLDRVNDGEADADSVERAAALIARARASEPNSEHVLRASAFLLRVQERWVELAYAAQRLIEAYPNDVFGYHQLANAKLYSGKPEEAIALFETALRLDPRDPFVQLRYGKLALASLLAERNAEAVAWAQKAIVAFPEDDPVNLSFYHEIIAAAEAWSGHDDAAARALAESNRLWPFETIRGLRARDLSSEAAIAQNRHRQEGLRRAGLRDHAEEDADFGVAADTALHTPIAGWTPMSVPGAATIRTHELAAMLVESRPVVIDTVLANAGSSLPGAVGLRRIGFGGTVSDPAQERLRRKMAQLTGGDLGRPVVAVGFSSERFDGRNLALRLAALGYTRVFWYRGGREAWQAAGMPETPLAVQDW